MAHVDALTDFATHHLCSVMTKVPLEDTDLSYKDATIKTSSAALLIFPQS
jgi:hypothetical protein